MMTPEIFQGLVDNLNADKELTLQEQKDLLEAIYELDANLVILQNALELSVANAEMVLQELALQVLKIAGRTDTKAKKKAAQLSATVLINFQNAIHYYLAGAYEQAQEMLTKIKNGESLDEPQTTTTEEGSINE